MIPPESGLRAADHGLDSPVDSRKVIVLDPGHGGHDPGVKGMDGSLEKEITLRLAFEIARQLKPAYQVVITRTGDYGMDLTRRTSVANHQKGALFISIHTGGSVQYHISKWEIYVYQKSPSLLEAEGGSSTNPNDAQGYRQRWGNIQLRYAESNRLLAEILKSRLMDNEQIRAVEMHAAPLRVLEGADMPAVLIETGYLTNPATEKRLNDPDFLSNVAADICKGIDQFFNEKTDPPA